MRYEIRHHLHFQYSASVFIEPMVARLRPRCDPTQKLLRYDFDVQPTPVGISAYVDLAGNASNTVWFTGEHRELLITSAASIEIARLDPFHFLVTDAQTLRLPVRYAAPLQASLAPYLEREIDESTVRAFALGLQYDAHDETLTFLTLLAGRIPDVCQYTVREHGDPWTPAKTLAEQRGACRDFALLFTDACRCVGIAARFVSGYAYTDTLATHHLHAWAEVYLPGAGWRGFDPSEGLSIGARHIAIAAGRTAPEASPTTGSYRGTAQPSLTATVTIAVAPEAT
ncbi:MAG: transglutaminase family protein [Gammaproteobacteria bacterium]